MIRKGAGSAEPVPTVGSVHKNGVVITEEIIASARVYADDVIAEMRKRGFFVPVVEGWVTAPRIHPAQRGAIDTEFFDRKHRTLLVWDFKNGRSPVEVEGNWQLINYVAALLDKYGIDGLEDQRTTVVMRIVQPNAYHRDGPVREWKVLASDLRAQINTLHRNAHLAMSGQAECKTGAQCKWCDARTVCAAAIEAGAVLLEAAGEPSPLDLTPVELAAQYEVVTRALDHIKSMQIGYAQALLSKIKAGGVPGWGLGAGRGSTSWAASPAEVIAFGDAVGLDLKKPAAPITPKQAITAGVPEEIVNQMSEYKPGELRPQKIDTKEMFDV
jgi:hypothetical protein